MAGHKFVLKAMKTVVPLGLPPTDVPKQWVLGATCLDNERVESSSKKYGILFSCDSRFSKASGHIHMVSHLRISLFHDALYRRLPTAAPILTPSP